MVKMEIENVKLDDDGDICNISWSDKHISRFHASWLRMYCNCHECALPGMALNRFLDPLKLPENLVIKSVAINKTDLYLEFDDEPNHLTTHPFKFLREMCYCDDCLCRTLTERDVISKSIKNTDNKTISTMEYKEIEECEDRGVFKWLQFIVDEGFCVIKNVPASPNMVEEMAKKISYIDETNYGRVWDVKIMNTVNAGYTNKALAFHQDLTQYENAIGLLFLHAIRFDDCVIGGKSSIVDAFQAAEILKEESPDDFQAFVDIPVTFTTIDHNRTSPFYPIYLQHQKPHFALDYFGKLVGVNWSPATATPLHVRGKDVNRYFKASRKFNEIISRKEIQYRFKLEKGDLLTFNNRRMLHARDSFQSNGGKRHFRLFYCKKHPAPVLKRSRTRPFSPEGVYMKLDEVKSRYMTLARKLNIDVAPPKMGNNTSF